ncbi:MAG TPA: peptidylprolyl isomerase [Gemmatimonadales bacterium]|nr:peptidylprolyl isomerase [Gemmatimonadales bacterium]
MVRRLAVVSLFALAGCSGLRDALSAHQDVVARAAGQELTVTQLAELVAPVKQIPLRREVMERLADDWVDYQLLARAVARGDSLLDSATVIAVNWPAVMQRVADRYHDAVIGSRAELTPQQVDSAYNAGDLRWLDHILVRVSPDTSADLKAAKLRQLQGYLTQLRHGADFARLASQKSDDPGSAKAGGSLGLVARGTMIKAFEDAAWGLKPGQLSDPVQTPWGYHIIWRPTLAQVRDSFATGVKGTLVQRFDSIYADSVNRAAEIKIKGSAPAAARAAAQNVRAYQGSGRVLATYRGGSLTLGEFVRWLEAFPPQTRAAVAQAADSSLNQFLQTVVRNEILINAAKVRGINLTAADRDTIRTFYHADLDTMEARLGVAPESLAADTAARRSRTEAAAHRAERYFADLVSAPTAHPFFELPAFLSDVLRARSSWDVSPAGVDRALEKATALRGPVTPRGQVPGVPPMTPAPSGPPVGVQPAPGAPSPAKKGAR